uniref:Uncharacterized protein n=1 Tax=Chenopodium quinoa TaxID=63459 RepID=A0A803MIV5_CHEQI
MKDFEQVGRFCLVVLDINPSNVKALFIRRAMAAVELGWSDLAYWDLITASNLDPSNQEIANQLKKTKSHAYQNLGKTHSHGSNPLGLGLRLPLPKRRVVDKSMENFVNEQGARPHYSQ